MALDATIIRVLAQRLPTRRERNHRKTMLNAEDVPADAADAADNDHSTASARREFLRRAAIAGAGAVGLSLLSSESADAAPPGEALPGTYLINHNFSQHYMGIESQNGTTFTGRFTDGSR